MEDKDDEKKKQEYLSMILQYICKSPEAVNSFTGNFQFNKLITLSEKNFHLCNIENFRKLEHGRRHYNVNNIRIGKERKFSCKRKPKLNLTMEKLPPISDLISSISRYNNHNHQFSKNVIYTM